VGSGLVLSHLHGGGTTLLPKAYDHLWLITACRSVANLAPDMALQMHVRLVTVVLVITEHRVRLASSLVVCGVRRGLLAMVPSSSGKDWRRCL
jgi:hypothetical protein